MKYEIHPEKTEEEVNKFIKEFDQKSNEIDSRLEKIKRLLQKK